MIDNLSGSLSNIGLDHKAHSKPILTPATSDNSDEELADFVATWEDAIQQCRGKLIQKDYEQALLFSTPEKLLDNLRERERAKTSSTPWLSRLYIEMAPTVRMLEKTSSLFLIAMRPKLIETRIVYILFYVIIELSLQNGQRWAKMQTMLERATTSLRLCRHAAVWVDIDEELRNMLLKMFKALILFWANSANYIRTNPVAQLSNVEKQFEETISEMDGLIQVFEHYASMRNLAHTDRSLDHDKDMAAFRGPIQSKVSFPCHDLPQHDDNEFCGRVDELNLIDEALRPPPNGMIRQQSYGVYGMGGVGKSRLALAYATRFKSHFDAIFVIESENPLSISRSFTKISRKLRLREQDQSGNAEEDHELVQQWLLESDIRWLLIWDNVERFEHIRSYWPSSTGSLLLTTRYKTAAVVKGESLALRPFNHSEAWVLYTKLMKWNDLTSVDREEVEAAKLLLDELQGLALGIRQMVALIKVKGKGVANFLNRYRKGRLNDDGSSKLDDYNFSLDTVWQTAFDTLKEKDVRGNSFGFRLLGVMAYLSPDRIPNTIFSSTRLGQVPAALAFCQNEDDFEDAVEEIMELALIDATSDHQTHYIHRLVQVAFDKYLDNEARQAFFDSVVTLIYNVFPQQVEGRPLHLHWKTCEAYTQHAKHVADQYKESQGTLRPLNAPSKLAELLKSCAWYLLEIGEKTDALELVSIAMGTCQDRDSILYAHLANTAGCIYFELNDLKKARPLWESALDIRQRRDTVEEYNNTLGNMANLYSAEGRLDDALACFAEAEATRLKLGNDGIIGLALCSLGIGRAQSLKGDHISAEAKYKVAKEIIVQKFGEKGHFMPDICYAFGNLERSKGNAAAAQAYYQQGLLIIDAQGTPTSIFKAAYLYKLACIDLAAGDLQSAKTFLDSAFVIAEQHKQDSPGEVARIMYKQAIICRDMGISEDDPDVAQKQVVSAQTRAMMELEKLPPLPGNTQIDEDTRYNRLVCAFFR